MRLGVSGCGSLPLVRLDRTALLLSSTLLLACQGDEPGGIEAAVAMGQLTVTSAQADALANLDVTVEIQAKGQPEEVSLGEVTITQQPVTDDSDQLAFTAEMMNPQGDDPVVRLAKGEEINVRVRNSGTTNADLEAWCRLPVELAVTLETADGDEATATANITVRCQ